jgi:flagella basal body P-ring formation protein FlgA
VEIGLRERVAVTGSVVRLGDIAEVTSSAAGVAGGGQDAALVAELASVPLMPAPVAGSTKFLTIVQVRDLLAANGVDLRGVTIRGAAHVAVVPQPASTTISPPGRRSPQPPSREVAAQQATQAIVAYLRQQTGHDLWNVTVSPDDNLLDACWQLGSDLPVAGGQAPWTGRQRFAATLPGAEKPMLIFAAVERVEMVAFALRAIERGDFVRATDVALQPYTQAVPTNASRSLDAIVGKEAVQGIRAGSMVMTNQVRAPVLVRRGERVSVCAKAAGVIVRTYATAQQEGSLGDLIAVQPLDSKEKYSARVSGVRELEVLAIGASADVAGSVVR